MSNDPDYEATQRERMQKRRAEKAGRAPAPQAVKVAAVGPPPLTPEGISAKEIEEALFDGCEALACAQEKVPKYMRWMVVAALERMRVPLKALIAARGPQAQARPLPLDRVLDIARKEWDRQDAAAAPLAPEGLTTFDALARAYRIYATEGCPTLPAWEDLLESQREHYRGVVRGMLAQPQSPAASLATQATTTTRRFGNPGSVIEAALSWLVGTPAPEQHFAQTILDHIDQLARERDAARAATTPATDGPDPLSLLDEAGRSLATIAMLGWLSPQGEAGVKAPATRCLDASRSKRA